MKKGFEKNKYHVGDKRVKNYDKINHLTLRSDIEQNNIYDTYLEGEGKICNEPETWGIVCLLSDGGIVDNYLYESESEYKEDLKIFGLLK